MRKSPCPWYCYCLPPNLNGAKWCKILKELHDVIVRFHTVYTKSPRIIAHSPAKKKLWIYCSCEFYFIGPDISAKETFLDALIVSKLLVFCQRKFLVKTLQYKMLQNLKETIRTTESVPAFYVCIASRRQFK